MTSTPHVMYGQQGLGQYGEWLCAQDTQNIDIVKTDIVRAVESIPISNNDNNLFTMADYGTADGSVTISLIRDLIAIVRKKHGDIPVQVVYEDQPTNDFNSIFKRIHGMIPDPPTYLRDFDKVYVMASGTSFYQQVVPDNTAHLVMSFVAVHYLSKLPTKFRDSLHRFPNASEEERKLATAQSDRDWENFLLLRARELRSGGVLVASLVGEDAEMRLGGVRHCNQGFHEELLNMWRRMRDEEKITNEEFTNTNLNICARQLEECKAPLEDSSSAVFKAGLRLISAKLVLSPCVRQKAWQTKLEREGVDDRAAWAQSVINQNRCWSHWGMYRGLADTRSHSEKEALVDELYDRLEQLVAGQDPRQFRNDYLLCYVFARKI